MANTNAPFGLKPAKNTNQGNQERFVPLATGQTLKAGDPIVLNAAGLYEIATTATTQFAGVAIEDITSSAAGAKIRAIVEPRVEFYIQTGAHALVQADVGDQFDLAGSTGAWYLDLSSQTVNNFLVVDIHPADELAAYARVKVRFSRHQLDVQPDVDQIELLNGDIISNPGANEIVFTGADTNPTNLTCGTVDCGEVTSTDDVNCVNVVATTDVSGATLTSTGDATVGGDVIATGDVGGATGTFSGALTALSLESTNDTTVGGDVIATGDLGGATLTLSGTATIGGDCDATGAVTGGNAVFTNDCDAGSFTVGGVATILPIVTIREIPADGNNLAAIRSGIVRVDNTGGPVSVDFDSAVVGQWDLIVMGAANAGNSIELNFDSSGGDLSFAGAGDVTIDSATALGKTIRIIGDGAKYAHTVV